MIQIAVHRIPKAYQSFGLLRHEWKSTAISMRTMITTIFSSCLKSVLLYACGSCKKTLHNINAIQLFINHGLRRILRIFQPNNMQYATVRANTLSTQRFLVVNCAGLVTRSGDHMTTQQNFFRIESLREYTQIWAALAHLATPTCVGNQLKRPKLERTKTPGIKMDRMDRDACGLLFL